MPGLAETCNYYPLQMIQYFFTSLQCRPCWAAWQETNPTTTYVPDMAASDILQFHRIDDALYSVFEETVTPRDMLEYTRYYEYDTLSDLRLREIVIDARTNKSLLLYSSTKIGGLRHILKLYI